MKRIRLLGLVLVMMISFSACEMTRHNLTYKDIRTQNRKNMSFISLGISKEFISEIMGNEEIRVKEGREVIMVPNPYRTMTLRDKKGRELEVLLYYTDIKKADGEISDEELTPFVLEGGFLTGIGWKFLENKLTAYSAQRVKKSSTSIRTRSGGRISAGGMGFRL